jgi:hypothetical protein
MKRYLLCTLAIAGLAVGCTETRQNMGAAAENDQNVLTGGPVSGTTLRDLPQPVRDTLRRTAPTAEVADIDAHLRDGRTVYQIQFIEPGTNPTLHIAPDGQILPKD